MSEEESSWRERQLARKEERLKVRQEAARKAKARKEGRLTDTPARMKDGENNPEYMKMYLQKLRDEGLMGEKTIGGEWDNLAKGYQGYDHPDLPPGEDDQHLYNQ